MALNKQTLEFYQKIASITSTKEKLEFTKKCLNGNAELSMLLQYHLSPYINFGFTKIDSTIRLDQPVLSRYHLYNGNTADIRTLSEALASRSFTGHTAMAAVNEFLDEVKSPEEIEVYTSVLLKRPIGIGPETVNKAVGRTTIHTFACILADNEEIDRDKIDYGKCIFSEKLDGVRCLIIRGQVHSRTGQVFPNLKIGEHLGVTNNGYRNSVGVLDGELWSPNMKLQEIAGLLNKIDAPIPEHLKFYAFDRVEYAHWLTKKNDNTYSKRLEAMATDILRLGTGNTNSAKNILSVPTYYFSGRETMETALQGIIARGGEGLMGRRIDSPYIWKRSRNSTQTLFKIKPFKTIDLPIVDFYPGEGKYEGMMGGVVVSYKGNTVRVGSGWNDEQRKQMWKNKKKYLGKYVEVKYLHESQNKDGEKSLNLPTVVRLRPDKDK